MNNAVIYARFSPRPEREGDAERIAAQEDAETIRLQVEVCQRYAVMKSFIIMDTIKDPETSARKTRLFEREGGSQLRFLPRGTHIICSKLDRMFRSTTDGLISNEEFTKRGIILHFADQGGCTIDTSTGYGELIFTTLLSIAALEPRMIADRTSQAMKHRQRIGQRMTAVTNVPFGWMTDPEDDSVLIPCWEESDAAQKARELHASGMSLRGIAQAIGKIRGKTLSPQSIKNLMSSCELPPTP